MVKKLFFNLLVVALLLSCNLLFSQKANDTIGYSKWSIPQFCPDHVSFTIAQHPNGGYMFGTNSDPNYEFDGVAQGWDNTFNNIPISDVFLLVYKPGAVDPSTKLTVTLYNTAADGAIDENGSPCTGPGTSFGTTQATLNDLESAEFAIVPFANDIKFSGKIIVGVDYSEAVSNGDVFGFVSDKPGNGKGYRLAFNHTNGTWIPTDIYYFISTDNPINCNIGILPVISSTIGIDEMDYVFDVKASVYPNPASNNATLSIDFKNKVENAILDIIDSKGAKCKTLNLGTFNSGRHDINLDLSSFKSGNYFFSINTHTSERFVKRFSIVK